MRDLGYDFRWFDRYCHNLFAKGFEADINDGKRYNVLTAFEVFEHLLNPMKEIEALSKLSDNILFSTLLVPSPPPRIVDWWYYSPAHGQHIAFFTLESLQIVAEKLKARIYTNGTDVHLLTQERISARLFDIVTAPRFSEWFNVLKQRKGLLEADFQQAIVQLAARVDLLDDRQA
jgi:hypothetical protein